MPEESPPETVVEEGTSVATDGVSENGGSTTIEELLSDIVTLTENADAPAARREARDVKQLLAEAHGRGLIDSGVRELRRADVAEAFVGSVIVASPLLVEDGIFDIADHLFGYTSLGVPVFLLANTAFVVLMTYALLEWTGRNRSETQVLFGVVPIRLFMTLGVSLLVAVLLMTVWGRVALRQAPVEAIARINVLWTVGSLGAALGDIISDSDADPSAIVVSADRRPEEQQGDPLDDTVESTGDLPESISELTDSELLEEMYEQFDDLESTVVDAADRREVNRIRERTTRAALDDAFGDDIKKYTPRDIAEGFVGSVFFSIPFLVEDGVFDVAEFFLSFTVGPVPVFFILNAAFVISMVSALVYWAGPQDVQTTRPIFGIIPHRLVGIAVVSFLTAAALMTMWGRVTNWSDPVVALARISVVWTVASFGAALGDILPGESSGEDISNELTELASLIKDGDDRNAGQE